jgi:nondiscriminating glutamyl-tRNA synthetase
VKRDFQFIQPGKIRVRFAPATTGYLHVGGARTALFNFLFAKRYQGTFILRIEDTDKEKSRKEFEEDIINSLLWLGINWDEGPDVGGNFGPYRQSERGEIYKKYLQKLLEEKKAYFCFCSEEELEAQRQYQLSIGLPPRYNGKCRQLSDKEVKENIEKGKRWVIRFKVEPKKVIFEDLIRGKIEIDTSLIGDFVIAKSFTEPLYNFACIVDDFEMKISHVIRGEDHISNTPKQILLQEALDFPHPQYAHLPLILGPDRSKLSKRHGAVSISEYRKQGYLPEAIINFIAFLGWSPASEREFFSLSALIKEFSIERIQKSGAVFNIKKLDFLNGFYIRQKSIEKLTELCLPYLVEAGFIQPLFEKESVPGLPSVVVEGEIVQNYILVETKEKISLEKIQKIVSLYQERLKKLSEIPQLVDFFFKEKLRYEKDLLRWKGMNDKELKLSIDRLEKVLSKLEETEWTKDNLLNILIYESEKFGEEIKKGKDRGYLLWPLRVALTGKEASAGPFEIAEVLGKEKTLKRIREAKELLK